MLRISRRILFLLVIPLIAATAVQAEVPADSLRVEQPDSASSSHGFLSSVIAYFANANKKAPGRTPDFSFIGGPHYSSDTGFGIGLMAAGIYSTSPSDPGVLPSNISVFADATTGRFFKVGVGGTHIYHRGDRRVSYEVSFQSFTTYFWGIGYDAGHRPDNKSKYQLLDVDVTADHLWRLSGPFFAGPLAEISYIRAKHIKVLRTWQGVPRHTLSAGVGLRLQFDTRDNLTAPRRGWLGRIDQTVYPRFIGNGRRSFGSTEVSVAHYASVWEGGVIASRLHGCFTYGRTPWGMMPTVGGRSVMRGYYEGQYRDKCETDIIVELRQKVAGRSGVAVWGALGAVYPDFSGFRGRYFLPNCGVGYRWEFKKDTNVRLDVGIGKGCWGLEFNINEAF